MKNFFNFKMKKLPVILCGTLVALFAACGDDNGSPENLLDLLGTLIRTNSLAKSWRKLK